MNQLDHDDHDESDDDNDDDDDNEAGDCESVTRTKMALLLIFNHRRQSQR